MRVTFFVAFLFLATAPAFAQFRDRVNVEKLNRHLNGRVDDYTHNEGVDRRVFSPILGMPRDAYVYVPPGYDPARYAYPLVIYLHMADVDEHTFVGSRRIVELDRMIARGEVPPMVVVAPDGLADGENRIKGVHSFFVNGCDGRFQDYLVDELLPFVMSKYSIRPERGAHALLGVSAGGFGAMNLALKRRDLFGSVATLSAPLNLRYGTTRARLGNLANFDPSTYSPANHYDPELVVGRFYAGLSPVRAKKRIEPIYGCKHDVFAAITRENPADLLSSTNLQPGELNIYTNFGGLDSYNFDAQAESFAWLAALRGVQVSMEKDPLKTHSLPYFNHNHIPAYRWLGCHILPPAPIVQLMH